MIIFYLSKNNPYVAELRLIIKFYTTMNHSNTIQTILIAFALYSCTSNDYEKLAWNVAKNNQITNLRNFLITIKMIKIHRNMKRLVI